MGGGRGPPPRPTAPRGTGCKDAFPVGSKPTPRVSIPDIDFKDDIFFSLFIWFCFLRCLFTTRHGLLFFSIVGNAVTYL